MNTKEFRTRVKKPQNIWSFSYTLRKSEKRVYRSAIEFLLKFLQHSHSPAPLYFFPFHSHPMPIPRSQTLSALLVSSDHTCLFCSMSKKLPPLTNTEVIHLLLLFPRAVRVKICVYKANKESSDASPSPPRKQFIYFPQLWKNMNNFSPCSQEGLDLWQQRVLWKNATLERDKKHPKLWL